MTTTIGRRSRLLAGAFLLALLALPALAASAQLDELTSTELRDRIAKGTTTVLVPIGGTEQNGPHMVLGKHNVRVHVLATRIAERLGNAVVAPVIAYVPEGAIDPPTSHMRWPGTISISETAFEAVLEGTARSFRQHGFRDVVFLGDHGGYQKNMQHVAERLNREWAAKPATRVHALAEYYRVVQTDYVDGLKSRGFSAEVIGSHAGLADTALALAVDPQLVHRDALAAGAAAGSRGGVGGDPRAATPELGQLGTERIVEVSVTAIRARTAGH